MQVYWYELLTRWHSKAIDLWYAAFKLCGRQLDKHLAKAKYYLSILEEEDDDA